MDAITYKIDQFEGPLDLLLSLIAKHKINIDDIPIAILCEQYLAYIEQMQQMDLELSSEFIVMASELMLIKSRMLLPKKDENEEDPRASLAAALSEYQRIKEASKLFSDMYVAFGGSFEKDTDEITIDPRYVADHDITLLTAALSRAYAEKSNDAIEQFDPVQKVSTLMKKRVVSVSGKIFSLMRQLRRQGPISAYSYFASAKDRTEMLSMFMAVLELLRAQRLILDSPLEESDVLILNTHPSILFTLDMTRRK